MILGNLTYYLLILTYFMRKNLNGRNGGTTARILQECRRRFSENVWPPGTSLPSNRRLAKEFGVSLLTMQRALDRLRADGLVKIESRKGTIVSAGASSSMQYGLVFTLHPTDESGWSWSSFNTGLLREMVTSNTESPWKGRAYFGVDGHADSKDYIRLLADLEAGILSGLFLVSYECLRDTPLLKAPQVPTVSILGNREPAPGLSYLKISHHAMIDRALAEISAHGRRKVAVLAQSSNGPDYEPGITAKIRSLGMTSFPHWFQGASALNPHWARNSIQLLLNPGQPEMPDALLVTDDNLLASACLGVAASGTRVPDELMIVSAWNFPETIPPSLPILKVGFDLKEILGTAVEILRHISNGAEVPETREIAVKISNGRP